MNPTTRRMAASGLAWTVGAAASVAVSILALSSINAGSAAGPAQQLAPDALTKAGTSSAGGSPSAADDSPDPASPSHLPRTVAGSPTGGVERLLSTPGGTVIARCTNGSAYLVSWSPAQGYHAEGVRRGPAYQVQLYFVSPTKQIQAEVHCVGGTPALDDDGWQGGHGDS